MQRQRHLAQHRVAGLNDVHPPIVTSPQLGCDVADRTPVDEQLLRPALHRSQARAAQENRRAGAALFRCCESRRGARRRGGRPRRRGRASGRAPRGAAGSSRGRSRETRRRGGAACRAARGEPPPDKKWPGSAGARLRRRRGARGRARRPRRQFGWPARPARPRRRNGRRSFWRAVPRDRGRDARPFRRSRSASATDQGQLGAVVGRW